MVMKVSFVFAPVRLCLRARDPRHSGLRVWWLTALLLLWLPLAGTIPAPVHAQDDSPLPPPTLTSTPLATPTPTLTPVPTATAVEVPDLPPALLVLPPMTATPAIVAPLQLSPLLIQPSDRQPAQGRVLLWIGAAALLVLVGGVVMVAARR